MTTPHMKGATFSHDVIVDGELVKAGTLIPFATRSERGPIDPKPPTADEEKRLRALSLHDALHELEGLCCVIGQACCSMTNLDALTLAGYDTAETKTIMAEADALMRRAKIIHDERFSNG